MKSLLTGLLIIVATTVCNAASTETITFVTPESYEVIQTDVVPVEQKVVEIHMSSAKEILAQEETKHRRKESEVLPLPGRGTCSGSFVDNVGDVLTAKHCVTGFDSFEVMTFDRRRYTATVIATSATHDLAMLHIDRRDTPFFEIAKTVKRGDSISVLGSPLGITDTLSKGTVARLDGDVTFIDCSALPGNSGGPVFNSDEKLVGVVTAGLIVFFGTTHLNMMQGLDVVYFFVAETLEKKYGHQ